MTFGQRLRELRLKNNITQKMLAEKIGVSQQAVARWESDNFAPTADTLIELANFFEVSADYLLGRTDHPSPIREFVGIAEDLTQEELAERVKSLQEKIKYFFDTLDDFSGFMQKWAIFLRKLEDHSLTFDEFEELVILYNEALEAREETQEK